MQKSKYAIRGIEPDLLIFIVEQKRICKVIELKDGDSFDTKKSTSEREHLESFSIQFGAKIPFVTEFYICCFNQEDKELIKKGLKNTFEEEHILTGRELCAILKIDYDKIISKRQHDGKENLDYFVEQLLQIKEVKNKIFSKIKR